MFNIDLHGLDENQAILKINTVLWELEEGRHQSVTFITGNGQVLKDLVIEMVQNEGFNYETPSNNPGVVIVHE